MPNLGPTIKKARRGLNISQDKLAKKLSVSRPTIWAWESGIYEPNGHSLLHLMKILNLSVDDFFKDTDDIFPIPYDPDDPNAKSIAIQLIEQDEREHEREVAESVRNPSIAVQLCLEDQEREFRMRDALNRRLNGLPPKPKNGKAQAAVAETEELGDIEAGE